MERTIIRPVRPSDEKLLVAFYAALSDESRHARFLGCARGLDPRIAHSMCCGLTRHEAGFVAELIGREGRQIVGHICLTDAGANTLEVGIAVADGWQGHGLGRRLFGAALEWAERSGIATVVATAFSNNARVLRLLRASDHETVVRDAGAGVSTITIDLGDRVRVPRAA